MTPLARLLSLRAELRDEAAAAEVTPTALAAYAERAGWHHDRDTKVWRIWTHGEAVLTAPRAMSPDGGEPWVDFGRRMVDAIHRLAEHEGRSPLAVWAELVGLPNETPPPRAEAAPGRPIGGPDAPEVDPAPADAAQALLPGFDAPPPERRTAQHRFGVIEWQVLPGEPLVPAEHLAALQTCPHCGCRRRRANTGARLGAQDTYSIDGETWTRDSPPCIIKR